MSNDLPQGIIAKRNGNAPQWALCKLSIKVDEFIKTLQTNQENGWCNFEVNISSTGKPYVKIDDWKPQQNQQQGYSQPQHQAPQAPPPPPFPSDNPGDQLDGLGGGTEETQFESF